MRSRRNAATSARTAGRQRARSARIRHERRHVMARREQENTVLPIPNGWFAVEWSKELIPGQVKSIHYFGEDLVIFRGRSGEAHVLDPYCPHLGAHLGEGGRVMGEALRCPFHGWTFDGNSG